MQKVKKANLTSVLKAFQRGERKIKEGQSVPGMAHFESAGTILIKSDMRFYNVEVVFHPDRKAIPCLQCDGAYPEGEIHRCPKPYEFIP